MLSTHFGVYFVSNQHIKNVPSGAGHGSGGVSRPLSCVVVVPVELCSSDGGGGRTSLQVNNNCKTVRGLKKKNEKKTYH